MKTKTIKLPKGKTISDIMDFLPSNSITNKTITACGATRREIYSKRHSLMAMPNVPVIIGKVAKSAADGLHIIGVYEKTTVKQIIKYLKSDVTYKKILCTPESYLTKVKPAFQACKINPFTDYYFLYDESEKIIQDISYRKTIIEPLDDFFNYTHKGFISATPIMPSDPRFERKGFIRYDIKPTYKYSKPFNLHITNNIALSVKDYLANNQVAHYSFFINSTDGILFLIKYLNIADESQVFCAKKSADKLKQHGFNEAHTELAPLKKYNFYTSRFFSAVDIEVDVKPNVVILSDLYFAEHTMIDPATEAVQIMGRFRNGINKITHITNVNTRINYKTRDAIQYTLDGQAESFGTIYMLYIAAQGEAQKLSYLQALKAMSYYNYVNKDTFQTNYFLIDNKLDEDMVKGYYSSYNRLREAYSNVKNFRVSVTTSQYPLSDEDRFKRSHPKDNPELFKIVVEQLEYLHTNEFPYQIGNRQAEINNLIDNYPDLCKAYFKLGAAIIEKAEYKKKKVKALLKKQEQVKAAVPFPAIEALNRAFKSKMDNDIPVDELGAIGLEFKNKYKLPGKVLNILQLMFDVSPRKQKTIEGKRVWTRRLSNPKFLLPEE
jgi:hypothetical protein